MDSFDEQHTKLWRELTEKDLAAHSSLRAVIQHKYLGKMLLGLAQENIVPYINNQTAHLVMAKYPHEVANICPKAYTKNERVSKAILFIIRDLCLQNRAALEANPEKTFARIIWLGDLDRRAFPPHDLKVRNVTREKLMQEKALRKDNSFQGSVQSTYLAKKLIQFACGKTVPVIDEEAANRIMHKHAAEVLNICPDGYDNQERVATAVLYTACELYRKHKATLEKNPKLTVDQIIYQGKLGRRAVTKDKMQGSVGSERVYW